MPTSTTVTYDANQRGVIESNAPLLVANARSGSGKTTTSIGYTKARPNEKFLYLCFGTANAAEARTRFPKDNVECRTGHSVAWGDTGKFYAKRVPMPSNPDVRYKATLIAPQLSRRAMEFKAREVFNAMQVLDAFFASDNQRIEIKHAANALPQLRNKTDEMGRALEIASLMWKRMCDREDTLVVPHDAYLKMWALGRPTIKRHIVLDEAQDTNPVLARVILDQALNGNGRLLLIGDEHQSIYLFRGAVDAMKQFSQLPGADLHYLTNTFRFGPKTADIANDLLRFFKNESHLITGLGSDVPRPATLAQGEAAVLARTNAQLFAEAVAQGNGRGVHWVGKEGAKNYRLDMLLDVLCLKNGAMDDIKDAYIRSFMDYSEFKELGEAMSDPDIKITAKIVEEYGDQIPRLVEEIKRNEIRDPTKAEVVFTTAHKAKGLEWNFVRLCPDFEAIAEAEESMLDLKNGGHDAGYLTDADLGQEMNLLYVAATRARKAVQLDPVTAEWIESYRAAGSPQTREERVLYLAGNALESMETAPPARTPKERRLEETKRAALEQMVVREPASLPSSVAAMASSP